MLADLDLLMKVWPELLNIVAYLRIRILNKYLKGITLFKALYKRKLDLSYLKVIGCVC